MTSFKTIAAAALVALMIPVAAVAKDGTVTGPVQLAGKGFFGGELTMASTDKQRPVRIAGRGGYVGILDLGGDLKVRCTGKGRVQKKQTERGTVYLCAGRAGAAVVLGSHFLFRGFAVAYRVQIPGGVEGTFHGRAAQRGADEEKPTRAEPGQRGSAPIPASPEDEEIPTLAELAAMLAGK
ncbi:MAG: hypothetical protein QOF45_362 [Gaiellaceae bacterium]|jgi:hypothetical protein|nr:hypothetical protein [Gaiellaceae bacterium]